MPIFLSYPLDEGKYATPLCFSNFRAALFPPFLPLPSLFCQLLAHCRTFHQILSPDRCSLRPAFFRSLRSHPESHSGDCKLRFFSCFLPARFLFSGSFQDLAFSPVTFDNHQICDDLHFDYSFHVRPSLAGIESLRLHLFAGPRGAVTVPPCIAP